MVVTHYTDTSRSFSFFCFYCLFRIYLLAVSVSAFFGEPAFFGAKEIVILLPSNKGICSTFAYSSKSFAKRSNDTSPCSFEKNGTTFKEHICFHLVSVLQESDGMFQLEVVVMIICLRSETDFLYVYLYLFSLLFLLTFL